MKRCTNPECGHIERTPGAKYCAMCGGTLVDVGGSGGFSGALEASGGSGSDVYLIVPGERIINVIKVVRQYTGLGLKEAKDLVESAPRIVCTGIDRDVAEDIVRDLAAAGARAEVRGGAAAAHVGTRPESERGFSVILDGMGPDKIEVIKVVRRYTALGLKEAKDLVESAPGAIVCTGIDRDVAENIKRDLEAAGARAGITDGYTAFGRRESVGHQPVPPPDSLEPGRGGTGFNSRLRRLTIFLIVAGAVILLISLIIPYLFK